MKKDAIIAAAAITLTAVVCFGLSKAQLDIKPITPPTTPGRAIKMGALVPLTGFLAVLGPAMKNNAQMAVDDVNGQGGVNGSQIQLSFEDTASDPNTAVQKAKKLINDDKVDVIIGTLSSAERWAVALSATNPAKQIFINPTYYEGGICNRYFFNVGALPNQQIDPFIPWAPQEQKGKDVLPGGIELRLAAGIVRRAQAGGGARGRPGGRRGIRAPGDHGFFGHAAQDARGQAGCHLPPLRRRRWDHVPQAAC